MITAGDGFEDGSESVVRRVEDESGLIAIRVRGSAVSIVCVGMWSRYPTLTLKTNATENQAELSVNVARSSRKTTELPVQFPLPALSASHLGCGLDLGCDQKTRCMDPGVIESSIEPPLWFRFTPSRHDPTGNENPIDTLCCAGVEWKTKE